MDELVTDMRKRIAIENNPRLAPNVYVIRYRGETAATAQAVVTSMLNIFVEDSLGANRQGSMNAQEFLREELAKLAVDLEASEAELAAFKKRNVGKMPGESGDYYARLQSAIDNLETIRADLQIATRRRDALRRQLTGEQPLLDSSIGSQSDLEQRLTDNRNRLEELQLRFTDQHPDVVATQDIIAQLEEQKRKEAEELRAGDRSGIASDNPVFQNIQIELTNVNVEIETLHQQESTQERQLQGLRNLADVLPQVEAELSRLTRDYDVKQTQYQSLLQRLEVAELSESAEQSEQVQFRVIDPPLLPIGPSTPNRPLLLFGVLVLGLGVGGGLAFIGNRLNPVFQDSIALRDITGLPVLGSVSIMRTSERLTTQKRQFGAFARSIAALCILCVILLLLHEPGSALLRSLIEKGI